MSTVRSPALLNDWMAFSGKAGFEADLRTEELFRSGRKIRLPHQSFMVLAALLERPGELVTREELQARVWPAGGVEYDQGLNAAVKRLREALRDSAEKPRFIETLPKRGYRFIAATQTDASQLSLFTPLVSNERKIRLSRKSLIVAAAGWSAILLVAATTWIFTHRAATPAPAGRQIVPFTSLPGQEIAPTFSPDGSRIAFAWNGEAGAGLQFDRLEAHARARRRARHQRFSRWSLAALHSNRR